MRVQTGCKLIAHFFSLLSSLLCEHTVGLQPFTILALIQRTVAHARYTRLLMHSSVIVAYRDVSKVHWSFIEYLLRVVILHDDGPLLLKLQMKTCIVTPRFLKLLKTASKIFSFARSLLVGRHALVCEFKLLQCSVLGTSDSAHADATAACSVGVGISSSLHLQRRAWQVKHAWRPC